MRQAFIGMHPRPFEAAFDFCQLLISNGHVLVNRLFDLRYEFEPRAYAELADGSGVDGSRHESFARQSLILESNLCRRLRPLESGRIPNAVAWIHASFVIPLLHSPRRLNPPKREFPCCEFQQHATNEIVEARNR